MPLLAPAVASAQEEKPPFYASDKESRKGETAFFGSLTSSSFYFTESGRQSLLNGGPGVTENASPTSRLFTELRLKLQADHISGGEVDFRADIRGRKQLEKCAPRVVANVAEPCLPSQSGTFGGDEREVKELNFRYRSTGYDLTIGRQFIADVAAIRFDGLRVQQNQSRKMQYFGFAGLYPTRGSRDVLDDYPTVPSDPMDPMSAPTRLLPVVAGAGGAYVRENLYGSVGVAGILPRANEADTGLVERNRILVSSNGYWKQSEKTDIYHYLVVDLAGSAGAGVSNVSLGVNHRASDAVSLFAHLNRVDTETLNVQAQVRLDQVDGMTVANIQNNWYVSRVAQESARAGATAAFSENRFQLTAVGGLRRRPELVLRRTGDNADLNDPADDDLVLPLAQAIDITLAFVDRKSYKRFRIGGSVTRSSGYKDENLDRSESTSGRVTASRDLVQGKGEFELNLNYIQSDDQNQADTCGVGVVDPLACYGTSSSTVIGAGGTVFYRPKNNWYAMAMVSVGQQTLTTVEGANAPAKQPGVTMLTGFARLAYRF